MRARALLTMLVLGVAALALAPASAATVTVEVRNDFFSPRDIALEVGDTVVWNVIDGGHTVTADDPERIGCGGPDVLDAGEQVTCTFTEDETFYYHCNVHGGMFGTVTVGAGSPIPPPGEPSEILQVPSETHPTIAAAVGAAKPRARIEVAAGTYHEFLALQKTGIEIVGVGPGETVIDAADEQPSTVILAGAEQTLRNLRVTGGLISGVAASGATNFTIDQVVLDGNGRYGVQVTGSHGGWIASSTATGHGTAGFGATDCPACDVVLTDITASGNFIGVLAQNAGSVVVRDSLITGNGTGIALRTTWLAGDSLNESSPQFGSHIIGNTITANTDRTTPSSSMSAEAPLRTGSGVWISAANANVVERNLITDHLYGVVVTGLIGPSIGNRIVDNDLAGSSAADIAWDGIGVGTCFSGNTRGGSEATAEPVLAQTIYDCALPTTIGVPYPPVLVTVLDHALL